MANEPDTHSEKLFTTETKLRSAAIDLSKESSNVNRKALRAAALAYAEVSNDVDEAMEAYLTSNARGG